MNVWNNIPVAIRDLTTNIIFALKRTKGVLEEVNENIILIQKDYLLEEQHLGLVFV